MTLIRRKAASASAGDAGGLQSQQGAAERARRRNVLAVEPAGASPALAMIGLGEVRELEISCESFGNFVSLGEIHLRDEVLSPRHQIAGSFARQGIRRGRC